MPEAFCSSAYCLWELIAAARADAFGQMRGKGAIDSTGGYSLRIKRRFVTVPQNDSSGLVPITRFRLLDPTTLYLPSTPIFYLPPLLLCVPIDSISLRQAARPQRGPVHSFNTGRMSRRPGSLFASNMVESIGYGFVSVLNRLWRCRPRQGGRTSPGDAFPR